MPQIVFLLQKENPESISSSSLEWYCCWTLINSNLFLQPGEHWQFIHVRSRAQHHPPIRRNLFGDRQVSEELEWKSAWHVFARTSRYSSSFLTVIIRVQGLAPLRYHYRASETLLKKIQLGSWSRWRRSLCQCQCTGSIESFNSQVQVQLRLESNLK